MVPIAKQEGSANIDDLVEISNNRIVAKFSGQMIISGHCYAKGTGAQQVWVGAVKYNTAATSFDILTQSWTSTNETAGFTLIVPSKVIKINRGESIALAGGSAGGYALATVNATYSGITIICLPD